ncbi:MAG TPA: SpoIIE family protein phosphatase [Thermoanaerobaculia bacterium]|nr:SpoIIE family protein phosphatase [Thermoanaerobaculia bacterium]
MNEFDLRERSPENTEAGETPAQDNRYRELFDAVQDIIYVRDFDGVILDINDAGARFFGRSRDQMIGATLHKTTSDKEAQSLLFTNQHLLEKGTDRSTVEMRNADGEERTLESTTSLMYDAAGRVVGVYGIMRDVTESVLLQKSLEIANEKFVTIAMILNDEKNKTDEALQEAQIQRSEAERQRVIVEEAQSLLKIDHARKTEELEDARRFQLSLLPPALPLLACADIAVCMRTATEVGGDYYDFSSSPDGTLTIAFGDATGHGLRAGILGATAKSYFQMLASRSSNLELIHSMNLGFKSIQLQSLYMSILLLKLQAGEARIVSAGMPPVFLFHNATESVEMIELRGFPLGLYANCSYDEHTLRLQPSDVLLLVSDGLVELFNGQEEFGYDRVRRILASCTGLDAVTIIDRLTTDADAFRGDRPLQDDLSIIAIRMR